GGLRDRDQPAQRRHDAPVSDVAVPDRWELQRGNGGVYDASRRTEIIRRQRPCALAGLPGLHAYRSFRHRRPPWTAFRSIASEGDRLPYGERRWGTGIAG